VHGGAVYFHARRAGTTLRWTPGGEPEPLPYRVDEVDPYSGVAKAHQPDAGFLLVSPDGTTRPLPREASNAHLAPGGTRLCQFQHQPATVRLFEASEHTGPATVYQLPPRTQTAMTVPSRPVWEDADHLLMTAESPSRGPKAVRLDVRTGATEAVPMTDATAYRPVLIRPVVAAS